jgi:allantoinase
VFESEAEFIAAESHLHYRHRVSPYLGEKLRGVAKATYLRGDCIFSDGEFPGEPKGRELRR